MKISNPLCIALLLLMATVFPVEAAPVKIGLYKGSVSVTQTLTESGATVKRTFSVSGRIRDNATFVIISQPLGISNTQLNGRSFTGTMNLSTASVNFFNSADLDGSLGAAGTAQGSFSGDTLKVTLETTANLGAVLGMTTVKRVFTLKRVGP